MKSEREIINKREKKRGKNCQNLDTHPKGFKSICLWQPRGHGKSSHNSYRLSILGECYYQKSDSVRNENALINIWINVYWGFFLTEMIIGMQCEQQLYRADVWIQMHVNRVRYISVVLLSLVLHSIRYTSLVLFNLVLHRVRYISVLLLSVVVHRVIYISLVLFSLVLYIE